MTLNLSNGILVLVRSEYMKKVLFFVLLSIILNISPVNAKYYDDSYKDSYIHYKLETDSNDQEKNENNFLFGGMLFIAFLAISLFLIAYKFDDGSPDD